VGVRLGPAVLVLVAVVQAESANVLQRREPSHASRRPSAHPNVQSSADDPPAGLSPTDWTQIRRSIRQSVRGSSGPDPAFVHEAQLFGHADPIVDHENAAFGSSVAISGDTVVVGTPSPFLAGEPNSAYVLVRSGTTWALQHRLLPGGTGSEESGFGSSVSISGDTVVVGAPYLTLGPNWGRAYVFVRTGATWTEQQVLSAPVQTENNNFGRSVAVSADTIVVGASTENATGSAYVFIRSGTTWTVQQKLLASDGAANDGLGSSVSLSGETVVVGAPYANVSGRLAAGVAYAFVRSGTTWTQQHKFLPPAPESSDYFGMSVSLAGETALIGSPSYAGGDAGAASVFVRTGATWTHQQELTASDGISGDGFGSSVALSDATAAVGAANADPQGGVDAGATYVFVRSGTTWTEEQKLQTADGAAGDFLGRAVAVSGDTLLAGAPGDDTWGGTDAGSAYVFVRSGTMWTEQAQLLGLDVTSGDAFSEVSISGDTLVVGAPFDDTSGGPNAGSVYVFVRTGAAWTEQQKLVASDGGAEDRFGTSVAASGDTLLVGAPGDNLTTVGSAYVFVRSGSTWTEQQKLVPAGGPKPRYGASVAVSGDTAVVGEPLSPTGPLPFPGSAYVFVRSGMTWFEQQKLSGAAGGQTDFFGCSVSISGETLVVGALLDVTPGGVTGSAYVFVRSGTTWTQQQQLLAADGAPHQWFGHSVSISGDTVGVGATGGTEGAAYVFVRSGPTWTQQQKLVSVSGFGESVALSGDALVIGSPSTIGSTGAAHVFQRTGTTWSEQQKLLAPDGAPNDYFGWSVALYGGRVAVGAFFDDVQNQFDAGSVHVFVGGGADLGVTKTDGQTTAVPGQPLTYTITASNAGPNHAPGASVTDVLPGELLSRTWSCVASPGSSCTGSGTGNIDDTVNLAVGGNATYTVTGTVDAGATGSLSNTATVTSPPTIPDPNPANNSATDVDTLAPTADLSIVKTDSADPVSQNDPLTYVVTVKNTGPSNATGVTVTDTLPAGVTFVSSVPGPPTCNLSGATLTCGLGALAAGASATVSIDTTVSVASGLLVNSTTVSAAEPDPDSRNNSDSEATAVGGTNGELSHGTDAFDHLGAEGGTAAEDVFRINQKPYSSYEVVVDATSGDIGNGAGPLLERIGADGTIVQTSLPVGTGSSRSLRWANTTSGEVEGETIRVRSAQCGTDCGPDDVYRVRAYETTYSIPRFNNAGTQITVLILQNPADYIVSGQAYFRDPSGLLLAAEPFTVAPKATLVLDTAGLPGVSGVSGALTIAHDGRYGDLSGKTVALEPATGFSFDSPMVPRIR
jgi:uncharacterized repeat protein (TIGR01451 family)